ncbi:uncharacterized protein LOC111063385 isoform X2 [Nilaparvata lugens]|uniref:uncharacterized protein LOC111063385 isoform X2 n=1 Tax=Nilaparvata lugens TaxID=108931 RepID=UPI00193DB75F|nr:uncharacterized protein LOC111063385 isoform X2 [Nilaparvata lugens]
MMSVDSVAARREARRRKILENSSNRLTKILGQPADASITGDIPITATSEHQTQNGTALHEQPMDLSWTSGIVSNRQLEEHDHDRNDFSNFLTEQSLPRTTSIGAQESAPQEHSNRKDNKSLWIISYILLGLVVRLMFEFDLGVLFADSLCMPFVTMLVARYMTNPDLLEGGQDANGQGFIKLALMMCGIRQTALDKVFLYQSLITNVVFDFSLYFFSFTLTHELFSIISPSCCLLN